MQPWVGPTVAISLVVIALSIGAFAFAVIFGLLELRRGMRQLSERLQRITDEAHAMTTRVKGEIEGFADLSTETRRKLRRGIDTVEERLQDLDALVEVMQEEAQETALDVAAFVRTARHAGGVLGVARKALRRRRGSRD